MSNKYSTGPIENQGLNGETISKIVFVKVLNNDEDKVKATVEVFALNGKKESIGKETFKLNPESSSFVVFDVSDAFQYEVEIKVDDDNVLISVFPKDENNNLVAAQRVIHKELTRI